MGKVVHSDVCGPMSCTSVGGAHYFVSFVDECSGFMRINPMKAKSEVQYHFKKFLVRIERRSGCTVKRLHRDNGEAYTALEGFLNEKGMEISRSKPYSLQENPISERTNRTVVECARSMLQHSGLPACFWAEAGTWAADIRNRFFAPGRRDTTSFETVFGRKPRIDHLRVFGSQAWVLVPKEKRDKISPKSEEDVLLGSLENSTIKVWIRDRKIAIYSRDARVDGNAFPGMEWYSAERTETDTDEETRNMARVVNLNPVSSDPGGPSRGRVQKKSLSPAPDESDSRQTIPGLQQTTPFLDLAGITYEPPPVVSLNEPEDASFNDSDGVEDYSSPGERRYPSRDRKATDFYGPPRANMAKEKLYDTSEPRSVPKALKHSDANHWVHAINPELKSLQTHGTWEVVRRPTHKRVLSSKFIFQRKYNSVENC